MFTTGAHGDFAFQDLGPMGGSINQIPVLVSDGLTARDVILADASGIAGASGDLILTECGGWRCSLIVAITIRRQQRQRITFRCGSKI